MKLLLRLSVASILIAAVGAARGAQPAGVVAQTNLPTFGEPTVSGVQGYGFEQDARVDTSASSPYKGTIYTSAPDSLSSGTSFLWRSLDGGQTFKWVPAAVQPTGKIDTTCAGGGDSELATDSVGRVYFNDLTLANFSTSVSSDRGKTFTLASCAGVADTVVDRQWYAVDGDPANGGHVFLAYDRVAQSNPTVCPGTGATQSTGNILVVAQSPITGATGPLAGVEFAPSQVLSCDEGIMGNDEFHDYGTASKPDPKVFVVHDNAAFNSVSMARCDVVPISPTSPTGFANCVDNLISSFPNAKTGGNFVVMGIDSSGGLIALWEQAPLEPTAPPAAAGNNPGDSALMYSVSNDKGNTWSAPKQLPNTLPGGGALLNNWGAWVAGGDNGKFDVAWYGTTAHCDQTCVNAGGGPDQLPADSKWSIYMQQTLDDGATWMAPLLASEHFVHVGNIQSVMGGQQGNRTLGDFMNVRIGPEGEANISYADSNNIDQASTPQAMFVRQDGGPSVFGPAGTTVNVTGVPGPSTTNGVTDPSGDGTLDTAGTVSPNISDLDILGSSMTQPDSSHYRITMKVKDLTSLAPPTTNSAVGQDQVWLTQWHVPSSTDPNGGKIFFVYMEQQVPPSGTSTVPPPVCYAGENAEEPNGGGIILTYPGITPLTGSACQYTATAPGTITITVPKSDVAEANPIDSKLYSVTASTMLLTAAGNSVPFENGLGGVPPSLVDVAPGYDFDPSQPTASRVARFTADRLGSRVTFRWRLATATGIVGFNIVSGMHRVNRDVIPVHAARTYRFTTTTRAHGPYTLQVLLRTGRQLQVGQH